MSRPLEGREVAVIGAGVAGLTASLALAGRGARVVVYERSATLGAQACSWMAGGMLAPYCERDGSEPQVSERGMAALDWWPRHVPGVTQAGSLVVAAPRDRPDLVRFAARTSGHETQDAEGLAALEPDLAGRFTQALWFPDEAHLDPRRALEELALALRRVGGHLELGASACCDDFAGRTVVDCRGWGARDALPALRAVRGEMMLLRSKDIRLHRPVRLLHPRTPVYVIPRADGLLMLGATSIESEHAGPVSARSAMELLNAAYLLHPALADAEIVELGVGLRPAFPDNLPAVVRDGHVLHFNGLYRHGFLLSPWYAEHLADDLAHHYAEAA
jgi:glycine oxidase